MRLIEVDEEMELRRTSYRKRVNGIRRNKTNWMIRPVTGSSSVSPSLVLVDRITGLDNLTFKAQTVFLSSLTRKGNPSSWTAADQIPENNQDSPRGTIDLHGLYVKEAIERTEKAIADGQRQGMDEMRVIVGKGIHSQGHVAKIKPAVQDLMRKYVPFVVRSSKEVGMLILP